jgi:SHS family lactate transporter-like MFS transporter
LYAFLSGLLGWTFDSFDFFTLTFVLVYIAQDFHLPVAAAALALTASLVMRPVGAILFGMLGDRYGRRRPLMAIILINSFVSVLCGLSRSFHELLILRAIFGIGMGGVWGLSASLALESAPAEKRGTYSGILQEGYAIGYLLSAVAFGLIFPHTGWRPLFFLRVVPGVLTVLLLFKVQESRAWKAASAAKKDWGVYFRTIAANGKRLLYLSVLMSMLGFLSHGTQDLYQTFLLKAMHFTPHLAAIIIVISQFGAIVGGTFGGFFSDHFGRKRTMISAELCALLVIPLWIFSHGVAMLAAGAFLMNSMMQATWGVVPAHLNELIPDSVRALLPGFAYQIGIVIASTAPVIEAVATRHFSYAQSMGGFVAVSVIVGIIVIAAGPEAHHVAFGQDAG